MSETKHESDNESSREKTAENEVGHNKSPNRTRFVKGQSGNPNGRPKRREGISIVQRNHSDRP